MRTVTEFSQLQRAKPTILTIGTFDGVHQGHQWLIRQVTERAHHQDFDSMVVTFDPPPQVVLRPGSCQLMDAAEKQRVISALDPSILALLAFSRDRAQVTARYFLSDLLDHVNMVEIWVGADFAFGHNREGTVDFLIENGQKYQYAVHVVPRRTNETKPISSTRIRELASSGDVAAAHALMGHYFSVPGTVVRGAGRGSGLGFPTANVEPKPNHVLPSVGIYAALLRVNGLRLPAAVSVGFNPVFGGDRLVIEAYVLDWQGDLRDRDVAIEFVERLRDEVHFDSVEALIEAMGRDVNAIRTILAGKLESSESPRGR